MGEQGDSHVVHTTLDDGIGRAIRDLVPAVHESNSDLRELVLDLLNSLEQIIGGEALSVKDLGTDCDGIDDIFVSVDGCLQGGEVLVEGLIVIGPDKDKEIRLESEPSDIRTRNDKSRKRTRHPGRP